MTTNLTILAIQLLYQTFSTNKTASNKEAFKKLYAHYLTGIKFQEDSNCALCCLLVSLVVVVSAGPNSTMSSYEHLTRLHTKCNVVHHSFLPPSRSVFPQKKPRKHKRCQVKANALLKKTMACTNLV